MADLTDAYSALQAADAAGNAADAKQLADYIRSQGDSQSAAPTEQPTDIGRQVALTGRAAAQGVVGALTLPSTLMTAAANTPAYLANKLLGTNYPYRKSLAEGFSDVMTKAGAPVPQTSEENLAAAGVSGLTGGLATGGAVGLPGLANAARAGGAGASSGLSQETARQMGLPPWMQVGAGILGGQTPAMLESAGGTVGNLVAPLTATGQQRAVGTLLNEQARDPATALMNLQQSQPIVPNSFPTSGAASQDVGLLGMEKYARGANAPAFGERLSEQNLARQTALGKLAGTPSDLNAAIAARSSAVAPMYASAATQSAPIDNEMIALMQRPSMQAAITKAQGLAAEKGQTFGSYGSSPGSPTSLSGQDLQGIKMALDDMKTTAFTQGIGSHQSRAMQDTSDALKTWMQKNVPDQRTADSVFQTMSAPVNRMQSLQDLQSKVNLTAADPSTGQYFMSPAGFNRALAAMKEDPFNGVTATDNTGLNSILKDLEQSQAVNGPLLKAPGSDTFQNLSLRQNMGGLASIAGKPLDALYSLAGTDKATSAIISKAMLDPKFAASLMQRSSQTAPRPAFRPYSTWGETAYDAGTLGTLGQGFFGAQR